MHLTSYLLGSAWICLDQVGHQIGKDRDSRILCRLRMDLLGAKLVEGPAKALGFSGFLWAESADFEWAKTS